MKSKNIYVIIFVVYLIAGKIFKIFLNKASPINIVIIASALEITCIVILVKSIIGAKKNKFILYFFHF